MRKLYKSKLVILLIFFFLFVFLGRSINNFSISKSHVAIALGIEYVDNNFIVTSQIVSPSQGSAENQSTNSYVTMKEKGATLTEAVFKLGESFGKPITLSHCNTVIISKNALGKRPDLFLIDMVNSYQLPFNAVILLCENSPDEIIEIKLPTSEPVTFYLQNLFNAEQNSILTKTQINMLLTDFNSKSKTTTFPICKKIKVEDDSVITTEPGEPKKSTIFLGENISVTKDGKFVTIAKEMASAINLVKKEIKSADFTTIIDGLNVSYEISKSKTKLKYQNGVINAELSGEIIIKEVENKNLLDFFSREFQDKFLSTVYSDLQGLIESAFEYSKQTKQDFLMLKNCVWQSEGYNFKESSFWDTVKLTAKVKFTSVKI